MSETNDPLALQQMGNWATQKQALHYGQITKEYVKEAIRVADQNRKFQLFDGGKKDVS